MKYLFLCLGIILCSFIISVPAQESIEVYVEVVQTSSGWKFSPEQLVIIQNYPLRMIYNNTDTIPHDFNVEYDGGQIHFSVFPNATASFETSYDIPVGQYEFYCAIEGHKKAGMSGILFVTQDLDQYDEITQIIQENGTPTISTESNLDYRFNVILLILLPVLINRILRKFAWFDQAIFVEME